MIRKNTPHRPPTSILGTMKDICHRICQVFFKARNRCLLRPRIQQVNIVINYHIEGDDTNHFHAPVGQVASKIDNHSTKHTNKEKHSHAGNIQFSRTSTSRSRDHQHRKSLSHSRRAHRRTQPHATHERG
ncbi:MAG: hypothetical protein IIW42_02040 [Bacteroidaceae bacterium]|nr:hypothetical protein [Bacteroidaceae bacterium]